MKPLYLLVLFSCWAYARPAILVAYHHSPPYSVVHADGGASGMDLEILHLLAYELDMDIRTVNCPLSRCLLMMEQSQLDLIMGLIKTPERQSFLNFIEPPYYQLQSSYSFYKLADRNIQIAEYEQLRPYSIGLTRGAVYFPRFNEDNALRKVPIATEEMQVQLLLKGRIDLVISVDSTFEFMLTSVDGADQIRKVDYQEHLPVQSYMALSKASPFNARIEEFSTALEQLHKQGLLHQVLLKYGIESVTSQPVNDSIK
ncbi:transporter substrate-binding domain-containing protein [Bowmanella sp. Y26]|uniref:substrate-binding periplasmic protein n=1 Tax=Bowmanella yangjiangensis TaxID=2811230 RepID=UPI001BDD5EC1|nr:transporter substrate-binding domain-containing protein [Bowmanella yangjiangensis]MBT1064053.1 transporter substrate-binding domain-containing protein [Bowmanella yangjiangensis]